MDTILGSSWPASCMPSGPTKNSAPHRPPQFLDTLYHYRAQVFSLVVCGSLPLPLAPWRVRLHRTELYSLRSPSRSASRPSGYDPSRNTIWNPSPGAVGPASRPAGGRYADAPAAALLTGFDLAIVDEAARCTASELSVPLQAGRWIILVGDQAQLEPGCHRLWRSPDAVCSSF